MGAQISDGTVSGLALKHARSTAGLTQADLAAVVDASLDTVQGWESGRRPLPRASAGTVADLRFELAVRGADGHALAALDTAARADTLMRRILAPPPARHVLAHEVITRETCDALLWPSTGRPPRSLAAARPARPVFGASQRAQLSAALRHAADAARGDTAPMLRRQAGFLLAQDPGSQGYVRELAAGEMRRLGHLDAWTPSWPAARGLAIAQAVAGDPGPLSAFLDHGLVSDATLAANLRYYAHWTGAAAGHETSDAFMAADGDSWRADQLLASLLGSLDATSPYVELTIRSVWSLLAARPWLLADPVCCARVRAHADAVLGASTVIRAAARRELDDIVALTRRAR